MTTSAPNHVTAEVDQAAPKRTKDGIRFTVTLSFPFKAQKPLAMFLMEQLGNPLDVDFTMMQPTLESVTITGPQNLVYVPTRTTVDGAPAEVMLPLTDGTRRKAVQPHPYKDDPENKGKCLWCNHGEAYTAHDAARIEEAAQRELAKVKSNGHRANPDELAMQGEEMHQRFVEAYQTPHAFAPRTQDDMCDACGHQSADEVHQPAVEVVSIPEHLRAEADEEIPLHRFEAMADAPGQCVRCGNFEGADVHVQGGNGLADRLIEQASETEAVPS